MDTRPFSSSPQELGFLHDFDSKLLLSPQARGSLDQQQQAKVVQKVSSGLPFPPPHNIKCSFYCVSIPERCALHISVHITRCIIRADVSLCTALTVLNWRGQPHHTDEVGQSLKIWNICRKLYSPTHAYSLASWFMESPYWLNPIKYLYGIWLTATLALILHAVRFPFSFTYDGILKQQKNVRTMQKNQPENDRDD